MLSSRIHINGHIPRLSERPFQRARAMPLRVIAANRNAENAPVVERRVVLLAGAAMLASPLVQLPAHAGEIKVENLSGFQKGDQRSAFQSRVSEELRKVLNKDDAAAALRTVINDAGTYDVATGTGGFNGSIRLELDRPENKGLKPYFGKLEEAKKAIDAKSQQSGIAPISWADLEVMALKVATRLLWRDIKLSRASVASGGSTIADNFGAEWVVNLGRKDADEPDPEGRVLQPNASVQEAKEFFRSLGNRKPEGGFGAGKPPFWERVAYVFLDAAAEDPAKTDAELAADPDFAKFKTKYDRSRKTVTRTDYEVDFIEFTKRAVDLNATRVPNAYLIPMQTAVTRL